MKRETDYFMEVSENEFVCFVTSRQCAVFSGHGGMTFLYFQIPDKYDFRDTVLDDAHLVALKEKKIDLTVKYFIHKEASK